MNQNVVIFAAVLILCTLASGQAPAPGVSPKVCPPEPQGTGPCPSQCTSCDSLGRCIIVGLNTVGAPQTIIAPSDRPLVVRCAESGSCSDLTILCSNNASCDVICGAGSCEGLWMECGKSNYSCSAHCDWADTRIVKFECDNTTACNCGYQCGPQIGCTPGVDCRGDTCFRVFTPADPCYPMRPTAQALQATYDPDPLVWPHCDCVCKNNSLTAVDFDYGQEELHRLCVLIPCNQSSQCGHGVCVDATCQCYNGWTGPRCDQRHCVCAEGAFCNSDGSCNCTAGFTGPNCDIPPECDISGPTNPICPAGCDECVGETCIIHARNEIVVYTENGEMEVTCPTEATDMRCLLMCDTFECTVLTLTCNSIVACDFVCMGGADCSYSTFLCRTAGVPCRSHCPSATGAEVTIGTWSCPNSANSTAPCELCDLGQCAPTSTCEIGVTCTGDPCSMSFCNGGTPILTPQGLCSCNCPPGTDVVPTENGDDTCLPSGADTTCACLDYGNVCVGGQCLCAGPYSGENCSAVMSNCPLILPTTYDKRPSVCTQIDTAQALCIIINPQEDVDCPVGWHCIIKCYTGNCNGINVWCSNGAGPCDWYCFGERTCLMATMLCSTAHPCRTHCTTTNLALNQVLRNHVCMPTTSGLDSCDCNSNCPVQSEVQNPCYLETSEWSFDFGDRLKSNLYACGDDIAGLTLTPIKDPANPANCLCSCPASYTMSSTERLCIPDCPKTCNNGGQCTEYFVDNMEFPLRKCLCFSGWTGETCDSRCFFPIPVEIISCENGIYVIANDMRIRSNEILNVLDAPDAKVIKVNGSVILQPNSTASLASNSSVVLQVQVGGDYQQSAGSVIKTSIVGLAGGVLIGTNVSITGAAHLAGTLEVDIVLNGPLTQHLQDGASVVFTAIEYGSSDGSTFSTITTNLPATLADGCSKPVARPQYESRALNLILSLDRSGCSPAALTMDAAANTGAIAAAVIVPVVVIGVIVAVVILKKKALSAAFRNMRKKQIEAANYELSVQSPTAQSPSNGPSVENNRPSSWKTGRKQSVLRNTADEGL